MEKRGEEVVKANENYFWLRREKRRKRWGRNQKEVMGIKKKAMQRSESDRCERQQKDMTQILSRCDKEKLEINENNERDVRRRGESDETEDKVKRRETVMKKKRRDGVNTMTI